MNSGVLPDEECQNIFNNKLRIKPSIQGMMLKYDGKEHFVLDRIFEKGFDFTNFTNDPTILPKDGARYLFKTSLKFH